MKVLLAHPGTQHSSHLAKQLYKNDLLFAFYTSITFSSNGWQKSIVRLLPSFFQKKISNRFIQGVPPRLIKRIAWPELKALWKVRDKQNIEKVFFERNKRFQEMIPDSEIMKADVIIGFDTSSWILAERCKRLGKTFILDISIAHPCEKLKVYQQINAQFPDWSFTLKNKEQALIELELKEMQLADKIVVASSFSKNSLTANGIRGNKIFVNPYGTDLKKFIPDINKHNEKVQFVFVGLVDARKGIPLLLKAWQKINSAMATLTLIGPINEEVVLKIQNEYPEVIVKGKVPYNDLPGLLSAYDVLVFPSYFEGFALVIPEAMASGLAVITTSATCGADILKEGESGFITPCGDAEMLVDRMTKLINDRQLLERMKKEARKEVQNFTWDAYGDRWSKMVINQTEK